MQNCPEERAAESLRDHLRLDTTAGWIGVAPGSEPELVVCLYKNRRKGWPTARIPTIWEGFNVQYRKSLTPVPCI